MYIYGFMCILVTIALNEISNNNLYYIFNTNIADKLRNDVPIIKQSCVYHRIQTIIVL